MSPAVSVPASWQADPWNPNQWRWWDGAAWTAHTSNPSGGNNLTADEAAKRPSLPAWASVPVTAAALPSVAVAIWTSLSAPIALLLGFAPMLLVGPVLAWMDRVEPEPWFSRLHALLWGGFVAGLIGLVSNTVVAVLSSEFWAAVVSAPISEEIGKALGIVWAVRRREVDSVMDGLVYAGWVALGFAIMEDFGYFAYASQDGSLFQVFAGRALMTPFAHPLFTAWTGLAIGMAVRKGKPLWNAWWGLLLAIGTHALWNGLLLAASPSDTNPDGDVAIMGLVILLFVALFLAAAVTVVRLRMKDSKRYAELMPTMAMTYGLPPKDIDAFATRKVAVSSRKQLPRDERRAFDRRHAAIARLVALHDRIGEVDEADQQRLLLQLRDTRTSGERVTQS